MLSHPINISNDVIKPLINQSYPEEISKVKLNNSINKDEEIQIKKPKEIFKLPKFKKNKRNEKETKFEIEEYNSSDTFEETKEEEINPNVPTKIDIQMKEAVRKYILYLFINKKGKWTDVPREDIKKVEEAFDITIRKDKSDLLNIVVKDFKIIDIDRLKRKLKEANFESRDMVGNITKERIPKLVIRIKDEIIPYNLLPIDVFGSDKNYKINGLSEIIGKAIEQVKTSTQNMDTETSIVVPIPNDLKSYITSSSKLPGQNHFFQKLKSADYYFNPNYIIEDSISINQENIQMNVSVFNAEEIQKDLAEYVSLIKFKEIDFELLANIKNFDEKKKLVDDIQNIIYPKLLKEDQIALSFNIERNKAIFIFSCDMNDEKLKEFNEKLSKINELHLINISEGDARELITNEVNINTLCITLSQQDSGCLILSLYCMKDDIENNKNRVLQIFSQYCPNEETIKLPIENLNKDVFELMLNDKKVIKGVRENYFVTKLELSKVKNKNKEKEYYLKVSILSSKLRAFKNDKDKCPFSFKNLIALYNEQLDKSLESEKIKLKAKALVRFIRNLGHFHNFKANHPKFCLKISSNGNEESDYDKESIQTMFENIFEKTCKARFPYEFEKSDSNLPLLMVYNAFAHFKSEGVKSITVPYGKKQCKIEESKVTLKSGSK